MPGLHDTHSHLMLDAFQKRHEASLEWMSDENVRIQRLKPHLDDGTERVMGNCEATCKHILSEYVVVFPCEDDDCP